jgi:hypothetical protein
MRHALSESEVAWRTRPFAHTGRFWGAATVACVVVPYSLWQMGPAATLGFLPYLLPAAAVAFIVIFARRILRPPRAEQQQTFIEFTSSGIWQVGPNSRVLLLPAPEVQYAQVLRTMNQIERIMVGARGSSSVTLSGLRDMEAALADLRGTFQRCSVKDSANPYYAGHEL